MPFDPDAYLKSKAPSFDPDAYLQSKVVPEKQAGPLLEDKSLAALQGFGQAATSGYLPQLQAAAGGLIPSPTKDVDEGLAAQGFKVEQAPDTYLSRRDQAIAEQERMAKETPKSYYGGMLGGAIASAPAYGKALAGLPGLAARPGAGVATKIGQAALGGAVQGAIQNPGDVQGQISPLQIQERVQGAKTGALVGGAAQGLGSVIKAGADAVANAGKSLTNYAQIKAFKSTGAMLKDFRKAAAFNRVNDIGSEMIERGYVKPGSTFEDVAEKAIQDKRQVGDAIGKIYEKANQVVSQPEFVNSLPAEKQKLIAATNFNPEFDASHLESMFKNELKGKAGGTQAMARVQTILQELKDNGANANISTMQEFKEGLDDMLKWNKPLNDEPLSVQYITKIRNYIKDKIQDRIGALDSALGSNALKDLKEANKHYGNLSEIARIAKDRVLRENTNRMFGLTDTIAGVGGASAGAIIGAKEGKTAEGALIGAGLGLANKLGRTYGNPMLTTGAYKAGQAISKLPMGGIQKAGQAIANQPVALGSGAVRAKGLLK